MSAQTLRKPELLKGRCDPSGYPCWPHDGETLVAAGYGWRQHDVASAAGVAVILLYYDQLNPLSGPFRSRQGYRPLWNIWTAQPAATIR